MPKTFQIAVIGPTGVGKTTTLAQLAANTILDAKAKNITRPKLCIFTIYKNLI